MTRAKITVEFEYDIDPDCYPDGLTPAEMVAIDVDANFRCDLSSLVDVMSSEDLTITGSVVEA